MNCTTCLLPVLTETHLEQVYIISRPTEPPPNALLSIVLSFPLQLKFQDGDISA
jgi:hypothetical protein